MNVTLLAVALLGLMAIALVVLVLLWAVTEELPRVSRIPYYRRDEPGDWAVRLERVGRRKSGAMRVVNEVLGGDIARAKRMTEHPPALIARGISEPLAREIVAALHERGAEAVAVREREEG